MPDFKKLAEALRGLSKLAYQTEGRRGSGFEGMLLNDAADACEEGGVKAHRHMGTVYDGIWYEDATCPHGDDLQAWKDIRPTATILPDPQERK